MTIKQLKERTNSKWMRTLIDYYYESEKYIQSHWSEAKSETFRKRLFYNNEAWAIINTERKRLGG